MIGFRESSLAALRQIKKRVVVSKAMLLPEMIVYPQPFLLATLRAPNPGRRRHAARRKSISPFSAQPFRAAGVENGPGVRLRRRLVRNAAGEVGSDGEVRTPAFRSQLRDECPRR